MSKTVAATSEVAGFKGVIRRFTFRRMILGSVIFGVFVAAESIGQGLGLVAAYPNAAARAKLVYGLASSSALGLFYGDRTANIASPAGYMVYRILPILTLVGAIWGLVFITNMLRGQEETGRWELLLTGRASARKATVDTIAGALGGILMAYVIVFLLLVISGRSKKFTLSVSGSALYSLAVVAGAVIAIGIGGIMSQLAATRRQALWYGSALLIVLFMLRSIGNVDHTVAWLKNFTPFGWIDKLHPYEGSQIAWLVPLAVLAIAGIVLTVLPAGERDMDDSFIADDDRARPKYGLLNSQLGFTFRITKNVLAGWLFASVAFAAVVAAVTKTVAKSLTSTGAITKVFTKLTGNPYAHIEIAYLSVAGYLTLTILMVMVSVSMGSIREEEASSRLDNFVSGNVSRRNWLAVRLGLLIAAGIVITFITNVVIWLVVKSQGIQLGFNTLVWGGMNILGPLVFLLGLGACVYGILPRWATIVMYVVLIWSFTIDIVASALKLGKYVTDTSLLHYISLVPAAHPRWEPFYALMAAGLVLTALGIAGFARRDLVVE